MRKLVIAPQEAHQNLLLMYRKDDPFCDVKLLSKSELIRESNYQSDERALVYLINKYQLDDEQAETRLKLIKLIKTPGCNDKTKQLYNIQQELVSQGLLFKNDLFDHELESSEIDVWYYDEKDSEISEIIQQFTVKTPKLTLPTYQCFENNSEELFFVFNKICDLLKSGVMPEQIALFGLSEDDKLIFKRMCENFGLNFNHTYEQKLMDLPYVKQFIADLETKTFEESLESCEQYKEDESYSRFESIVHDYKLGDNPSSIQQHLYLKKFEKTNAVSKLFKEAINVVSEPIGPTGGYLFIINFLQGKFPTITKNNDYLSDTEKQSCGITTSYTKNTANLGYFTNLLQQNCTIFLSYSLRNISGDLLPSPLIGSLNLKKEMVEYDKIYSKKEAVLKFATLQDSVYKYNIYPRELEKFAEHFDSSYRSYDNAVTNVSHYTDFGVVKLSYSSLTTYNECPFKYYLNYIVDLKEIEPSFFATIGQIAHHIFQNIDQSNDFDELYDKALKKYESELGEDDWIYLPRCKDELKKTFDFVKKFESQIDNPSFLREKKLEINLDSNTILQGQLDKVVFSGEHQDCISIYDYKTGRAVFDEPLIEKGFSLQLPIYSLLASYCYPDKTIVGLYIQKSMPVNSVMTDEDVGDETMLLQGVSTDNLQRIETIDSTFGLEQSHFIKGGGCKDGHPKGSANVRNDNWFKEKADLTKQIIIEVSQKIRASNYEIKPKFLKNKIDACKYCPFKDICLHTMGDYEYIKMEKNK